MQTSTDPLPVTVFTGFLGSGKFKSLFLSYFSFTYYSRSGKTTQILSLLKRVPKDYKVCLLKNEFGDIAGRVIEWDGFDRFNL